MASLPVPPCPVQDFDANALLALLHKMHERANSPAWKALEAFRADPWQPFNEFEPAAAELPGGELADFQAWRSTDPLSDWRDYPGPGWDRL